VSIQESYSGSLPAQKALTQKRRAWCPKWPKSVQTSDEGSKLDFHGLAV